MTARRGRWFWTLATATQVAGGQGAEEAIATETASPGGHTNEAATPVANTWTAFTTAANRAVVPTGGEKFSVDISAKIATGVGTLTVELEGLSSNLPKGATAEWSVVGTISHTFAATATQEWENKPFDLPGIQFVRWSRYQCTVANALSVFNGRINTGT
ncbi:MAG TPA: hypothetical protein VJ547_01810 [Candidatus Thermoplasmatota archaeon]|nr:hypothetical protein [Candidatus Thermoplasmatota archaeon]